MKRAISFILVLLLMLTFTACSGERITKGVVIEKVFTPEHTEIIIIPLTISNGKTVSVITTPYCYHYNDKWEVIIQAWNEDEKRMETATYRIEEEVYKQIEIGSEFEWVENLEPQYPEYTREKAEAGR